MQPPGGTLGGAVQVEPGLTALAFRDFQRLKLAETRIWLEPVCKRCFQLQRARPFILATHLREQLAAMHAIIDSPMSRPKVLKVLRMLATAGHYASLFFDPFSA